MAMDRSSLQLEEFSFPIRSGLCRPAYVIIVSSQGLAILLPVLLIPPFPPQAFAPLMLASGVMALILGIYMQHRRDRVVRDFRVHVDANGLELRRHDNVLWRVLWRDFGGYRKNDPGLIYEAKHPESYGVDVLDRSNRLVGVLPLMRPFSDDKRSHAVLVDRAFRKALFGVMDAKLQPPFASWDTQLSIPYANSPKRIVASLAIGLAFCLVGTLLVSPYFRSANTGEVLPDWYLSGRMIVLTIMTWGIACWGFVAGLYGIGYRFVRRRIRTPSAIDEISPEDLRLIQSSDAGTDFVSGAYEVKMDRKRLQDLNGNAGIVGFLCVVLGGLLVFLVASTKAFSVVAAVIGLLVPLILPLLLMAYVSLKVAKSQGDRLIVARGQLTVAKPDGRSLQFNRQTESRGITRVVEAMFAVQLWRDGGRIYVVSLIDLDRLS